MELEKELAKLTNALAGEAGNPVLGVGWLVEGLIASIITLIALRVYMELAQSIL